jgi:hypothetical protein
MQQLGPQLFPATVQLGIVPSRTYRPDGTLTEKENRVIDDMLADLKKSHQIFNMNVFETAAISHTASFVEAAGSDLAYFHERDTVPREAISRLGGAIMDRVVQRTRPRASTALLRKHSRTKLRFQLRS